MQGVVHDLRKSLEASLDMNDEDLSSPGSLSFRAGNAAMQNLGSVLRKEEMLRVPSKKDVLENDQSHVPSPRTGPPWYRSDAQWPSGGLDARVLRGSSEGHPEAGSIPRR